MDPRCGFNRNYFTSLFGKRLCLQWRAFSLIPEKSILCCFKTERFFHLQNACACSGVRFPKYLKTQLCNYFISFKKTPVLAVACVFPNTWKHNFVLFQKTTSGCISKSCQQNNRSKHRFFLTKIFKRIELVLERSQHYIFPQRSSVRNIFFSESMFIYIYIYIYI